MIKFLRKIRLQLLSEGQFGNYLKYAIGEIVLVVVGILIALQINNLNQEGKLRQEEQELLLQLKMEYQSNLDQLDQKITMRKDMIRSCLKLMEYRDSPNELNKDSVLYHIETTRVAPTFDPIINDIISSGRIHLLQNIKLKGLLTKWTSRVIQVTEEEDLWNQYRLHHYYPFLSKNGTLRSLESLFWEKNAFQAFHLKKDKKVNFSIPPSKRPFDPATIINHPEFESHLALCASLSEITNNQSQVLRQNIIDILNLIENDLNS